MGCTTAGAQDATPATPAAASACSSAEHHQFDFWIGEWDVVFTQTGEPAGHSLIERLYNGCALRENWSGRGGYSGGSLNFYDPAAQQWKQSWIGSDGQSVAYAGGRNGDAMVFSANATENGAPYITRMTFTPTDGNVRQYIERSNDAGATWAAEYDLTYRPVAR